MEKYILLVALLSSCCLGGQSDPFFHGQIKWRLVETKSGEVCTLANLSINENLSLYQEAIYNKKKGKVLFSERQVIVDLAFKAFGFDKTIPTFYNQTITPLGLV